MRWRSLLEWAPLVLFASLFGAGWLLVALDHGTPDVLLLATVDGTQAGTLLMLLGAAAGIVSLIQGAVLAGRLRKPLLGLLARMVCVFLVVVGLPAGYMLILMAAFTTVNEYQPLNVAGRHGVVQTTRWHHQSHALLEGDGLLFHTVATCGDALPLDGYDPFPAGEYDVVLRGGREVLRFAQRPGGPHTGQAVLGSRPGDDVTALCEADAARASAPPGVKWG